MHTQPCHTHTHNLSHTHNFVTHKLHTELCHTQLCRTHLCHTHTTLSHTSLSRTIFHTQLCQSQIIFNLSLATLSRTHIDLRFAWHAWHLWHWAGSGGALGRRWSPGALRHFAWEAWRLLTSTFGLRGRRGTVGTGLDLVARLVAVSRPTLDPPAARPAQRISRSADQRISGSAELT